MPGDTKTSMFALLASDVAFDPLEGGVRRRVRGFIEALLEEELQAALGRAVASALARDPRATAMGTGNAR